MTDVERLRHDPLAHLDYFTEWGGRAWSRLVRIGLVDYLGGDFQGRRVLEIGARYGRMSCLFALLGARVTGLEIHSQFLAPARREARHLGVDSQVEFILYDGNPDNLPQQTYDIVFSKSVLVLVKDLRRVLEGLEDHLGQHGKTVFIENGLGGPLLRLARRIKHHGRWDYREASYFTASEVQLVQSLFTVERLIHTRVPPIYLLCGSKR